MKGLCHSEKTPATGLFMGKTRVIVKFAATCVGSGVATAMKVYSFGAACGREVVGISKSSISSFAGKASGNVSRLSRGKAAETQEPRLPRAKPEKQPPAPESPRRKDKLPPGSSMSPNPKLDRLASAVRKLTEGVQQRVAESGAAEEATGIRSAQKGAYDERDHQLASQRMALAKIIGELKDMRDLVRKDSPGINSFEK